MGVKRVRFYKENKRISKEEDVTLRKERKFKGIKKERK